MENLKKEILKGILQVGLIILTLFSTVIFIIIVSGLAILYYPNYVGFMSVASIIILSISVIWGILISISRAVFLLAKVRKGKYLNFDKISTYFYIFIQYMFFLLYIIYF